MDTLDAAFQSVVEMLAAGLNPDQTVRQVAERKLLEWRSAEGFGATLTKVVVSASDIPYGIRQLGAVVLKQYVKSLWVENDPQQLGKVVSEQEKQVVRSLLPQGLSDPFSKIRTAVGMVIAEVAKHDCPEQWPELLPTLTRCVGITSNTFQVDGAVRCLDMFIDELGEEQVVQMTPMLLPPLVDMVHAVDNYEPGLRRKALSVMRGLLIALEVMSTVNQQRCRDSWLPFLGPLLDRISNNLMTPMTMINFDDYGLKLESVKIVMRIMTDFGEVVVPLVPQALSCSWTLFVQCLPLYQQYEVAVDADEAEDTAVDEYGERLDLEALVSQLYELLLAIIGSERYQGHLYPHLVELLYYSLGYMQMTASQVQRWSDDPNQYIADEEDDLRSARVSGELLMEELIEVYEDDAINALDQALQRRMGEAESSKASSNPHWWKLPESCLHLMGCLSHHFVEATQQGETLPCDVVALVSSSCNSYLPLGDSCPFLVGRVLWVAARYSEILTPELVDKIASCAAQCIDRHHPLTLRIGACRAVVRLAQRSAAAVQPHLQQLYTGVGFLLDNCGEDCVHLALETLPPLVCAHPPTAASLCGVILPKVLQIWLTFLNDPLLSEDAMLVVEELAKQPECINTVQATLLPCLQPLISNNPPTSALLLSYCLDMLTMLCKYTTSEVAIHVHAAIFSPVMRLVMESHDADITQSATQCIRQLLAVGGQEMLTWNGCNAQEVVQGLVQGCLRLLAAPEDSPSFYVGKLLIQMLQKIPNEIASYLPTLLDAVVEKLRLAPAPFLVEELLLVFGLLLVMNTHQTVEYLVSKTFPPGSGPTALEIVMGHWMELHAQFRGTNDVKLVNTALALLMNSPHQALDRVMVKGVRLDLEHVGPRTRSRAQAQPEQWSSVPLRVKLLIMLCEVASVREVESLEFLEDDSDDGNEVASNVTEYGFPDDEDGGVGPGAQGVPDIRPGVATRECIAEAVRKLAAENAACLQAAAVQLPPAQQQLLQKLLQ